MASTGNSLCDIPNQNLLSILFAENDVSEDFVAWRNAEFDDQFLTKYQARKLVRRLAHGYVSSGLIEADKADKDKVITVTENQVIGFPNVLAIIAAGGAVATCPWQATISEILFRIDILRPKAIICSKTTRALVVAARKLSNHQFTIIIQDSTNMTVQNEVGFSYVSDEEHAWSLVWNEEVANGPVVLVFSSGTTGSPKGVCISQKNIISMIFQLCHLFQPIMPSDRAAIMPGVLDNAHVAGLFINAFCGLGVGIQNVLAPATNIDLLLEAFHRYPFDILLTVPTVLNRMLAHPSFHQANLKCLRFVCTGAAPTPQETQKAFTAALAPDTFCQMAWGMTELTFLATMHPPGICGPWGSIGRPLAGNAIEIRDAKGNTIEKDQVGEIYVCGPTVTSGYYLANVQDHDAKQDDWLRTGDMGMIDGGGYVYVTGRNKDLIKYNGAQISPHELEAIIIEHHSVVDVGVVGLELSDGNELPTAFVVLKATTASKNAIIIVENTTKEIADFTNRQVSPYKRLRGGIHAVNAIPRNPMGKINYRELRELAKKNHESGHSRREWKSKI